MLNAYITLKGIEINKNDFIDKYNKEKLNKLLNKFIIRYKPPITGFIQVTKLYFLTKDKIILPRFTGIKLKQLNIIDNIINHLNDGDDINFLYQGKSNNNQLIIIDYLLNNIFYEENKNQGKSCSIIKMKAGTGKTYLSMDIINRLNKKTLIIVPNTYLLNQWVTTLKQFFPNNIIGQYYNKKKCDGDIIVMVINSSLSNVFIIDNNKYESKEFMKLFGLVIFDEIHMYCSGKFKNVFYKTNRPYMLGLSATPDERKDKLNKVSTSNVGDILDVETIKNYNKSNINFKSEINILKYYGSDEYTKLIINYKSGLVDFPNTINQIIQDPIRNNLIIENIVKLFNKSLNMFIFSDRRTHLENLINLLLKKIKKDKLNIAKKSIILYGGSSDDDIYKAKNESKIIFTTYNYSSTGVSIIKMNSLIFATPRRSNMDQILGRIFRLGSDETIKRIIIDIVDMNLTLKNQLYDRKKIYLKYTKNINIDNIIN